MDKIELDIVDYMEREKLISEENFRILLRKLPSEKVKELILFLMQKMIEVESMA